MNKINFLLTFFVFLSSLILTACPIWIEDDTHSCRYGSDCYCDSWGCYENYCHDHHNECISGYYCNPDTDLCETSSYCNPGDCPDGWTCDWRSTCVPNENEEIPCEDNEDCGLNGYCHPQLKTCVGTGRCEINEDCDQYGEGLICDDRGVCILDPGPCPDGHCGCTEDPECESMDLLCINTICQNLENVCVFNFECGSDAVCINNICHKNCPDNLTCPTGQECINGVCMDDPDGKGECVYNTECGVNMFCINATCHQGCEEDDTVCGTGEYCSSGICRADGRPQTQCSDTVLCEGDRQCLDGICRMPCAVDANCVNEGDFSKCDEGICKLPIEVEPICQRINDCNESNCINGTCQ